MTVKERLRLRHAIRQILLTEDEIDLGVLELFDLAACPAAYAYLQEATQAAPEQRVALIQQAFAAIPRV